MKNYFTDEQVNAIHKEICRLEDLDSGISMPFQQLNHIEIANLRRIMNLAVEAAVKHIATIEVFNEGGSGEFKVANGIHKLNAGTKLYSIQELDN